MNLKPRSDSHLDNLPAQIRERIDHWLFVENISYRQAARNCAEELNFTISPGAVGAYYRRQKSQLLMDNIAESAAKASEMADRFKDDKFCEAFGVLMGQLAFEQGLLSASATTGQEPENTTGTTDTEQNPDTQKPAHKPRRKPGKYETLIDAANLFFNAMKLTLAKRGDALDHQKLALETKKIENQSTRDRDKISALATGKRPGGISQETLREIEEGANLL